MLGAKTIAHLKVQSRIRESRGRAEAQKLGTLSKASKAGLKKALLTLRKRQY